MPKTIDVLNGDGTTGTIVAPSTPFGGGGGSSYSPAVEDMLGETTPSGIRDSIGVADYPYTTDIQSGTGQTRNLTSITDSSGYMSNSNLTSVYVGSNVTSLGVNSLAFCYNLTSITIPDSVTTIGSYAFAYDYALTSITLPASVTSIASYAFSMCTSLTSFDIGNSVTSIGSGAFQYCSVLTSVTIPDSVTTIGSGAFYYCTSLATINCLATTAPTLGSGSFDDVSATDIHVPVGATGYGTTYGGLTVVADL